MKRKDSWLLVGALVAFGLYAANFLFFFVDDEGIPFVYAQNLLRGSGLVYSTLGEGRVEGYSDFLHVVAATAILWLVRSLGWMKEDVFFIGKALSLSAGMATITAIFFTVQSSGRHERTAVVASLAFVALSGPFAVWSASSLESIPFAFLLTVLVAGLLLGSEGPSRSRYHAIAGLAAVALLLERIDGMIYGGVAIAAFLIFTTGEERRSMLRRVVGPLLIAGAVYHAWRYLYFGDILPMPAYAKVLFRFQSDHALLAKLPAQSYLRRFAVSSGTPVLVIGALLAVVAAWVDARVRPLVLALAVLVGYISAVGDWMYGFRFFTAVLPVAAIVIAAGLAALTRRHRVLGWIVCGVLVVSSAERGVDFVRDYERRQQTTSWWRAPSRQTEKFFGANYEVYAAARRLIGEGAVTAYNQAGFVPFMLDWKNVDNLGICTKFFAKMPVNDMVHTEVGRYRPMMEELAVHAGEAYLLYQHVAFVLPGQNSGNSPAELFGGYFSRIAVVNGEGIYARTGVSTESYRHDPTLFRENLAHIGSVKRVILNGRPIPPPTLAELFPFLRETYGYLELKNGSAVLELELADHIRISRLVLNGLKASGPVHIDALFTNAARTTANTVLSMDSDGTEGPRDVTFDPPWSGAVFRLSVRALTPDVDRVWLDDLRLQGQSAALKAFIAHTLHFD